MHNSGRLVRVFFRDGPHPSDWMDLRTEGPLPTGRFDHHRPGVTAGVMYLASRSEPPMKMDAFSCALAETFQLQRVIDVTTRQPCVVWWTSTRPMYLLDLASSWTSRAGGDQALCSGDRSAAQLWTRKIHTAFPTLDGLTWPSSIVGPGRSVAITERAKDAIPHRPDLLRPPSAGASSRPQWRASCRGLSR